eukprot:m.30313 g.30313  ORF g.30313 m.30313 type:complete len:53 (-) comp6776_c0_seq1:1423-1581(-)
MTCGLYVQRLFDCVLTQLTRLNDAVYFIALPTLLNKRNEREWAHVVIETLAR